MVLFYQDFKDTFVCNTQPLAIATLGIDVVLSGFQRYFCMQYTTQHFKYYRRHTLFYQDFKDTFVCNTQLASITPRLMYCCFIRISKILLYAIHNRAAELYGWNIVVLSGFQRYFCMQYTTRHHCQQ